MKTIRLILVACAFALAIPFSATFTGCGAPSTRVEQVKTLKVIGTSVEATMTLAAKLYHDGKINAAQWKTVADFHDTRYLPAFRLAVAGVQANLENLASPDIVSIASQLAAIVAQYQSP